MNEAEIFCRVCLQTKSDLSKIFAFKGNGYLPNIIYNISGVKISQREEPTAQICGSCAVDVVAAERIILQCQESEEYLLSLALDGQYNQYNKKVAIELYEDLNKKESKQENIDIDCQTELQSNFSNMEDHNELKYINLKIEPLNEVKFKANQETMVEKLDLEDEQVLLGIPDNITAINKNVNTKNHAKPKPIAEVKPTTTTRNNAKRKRGHGTEQKHYLHICDYCDYRTLTRKCFIDHLLLQHDIDDSDIYPCTLCEKLFSWRRLLFKHIEDVHRQLPTEKIFMCDECGKTYTQRIHLQHHRKQVHGAEFHKCPHPNCKQKFNRVSSLRRHFNNLHAQVKRFRCEICDKQFNIWDNWSYHMDVVHQFTKMTCPKCYCPFRNQKKFQHHMLASFCENWLFPCEYCKRSFPTPAGLKVHVQNIHQ